MHYCVAGRGVAAVDKDRADDGFEAIGEHRVFDRASAQLGLEAESLRHLDERFLAHEPGAKLGQLAFGELRKARVKLVGDCAAEHAVTEEFKALVVVGPALRCVARARRARVVEAVSAARLRRLSLSCLEVAA